MGIFKAMKEGVPLVGPVHYMQCTMSYNSKWIRSYRNKIDTLRAEVINLFTQPPQLLGNMRSLSTSNWASQCVLHVNGAVSLGFMLPVNYIQSAIQGSIVKAHGCPRVIAKAKAKAKAKARLVSTIIGKVPHLRK